jgi:hypothetical protein
MLDGYITYKKFGWLVGEVPIGGDAGIMVSHGWFVVCLIDSLRKLFAERALQRFYSIIFTFVNHMYNSYSTPS